MLEEIWYSQARNCRLCFRFVNIFIYWENNASAVRCGMEELNNLSVLVDSCKGTIYFCNLGVVPGMPRRGGERTVTPSEPDVRTGSHRVPGVD